MITEKEVKKAQEDIRKAESIIEKYEKQKNTHIIDEYVDYHYRGYVSMVEAMGRMEYFCKRLKTPIYCYQLSNKRFVITFEELNLTPERVLSPDPSFMHPGAVAL